MKARVPKEKGRAFVIVDGPLKHTKGIVANTLWLSNSVDQTLEFRFGEFRGYYSRFRIDEKTDGFRYPTGNRLYWHSTIPSEVEARQRKEEEMRRAKEDRRTREALKQTALQKLSAAERIALGLI